MSHYFRIDRCLALQFMTQKCFEGKAAVMLY